MKHIKKLASVVLAVVMILALATTAFAANDKTITLQTPTKGHTYTLYQIFTGTYNATTGSLGDIAWGTGVTSAGQTALGTAATVAAGITNTEAGARTFATKVDQYLTGGTEKTATSTESLVFSGLAEGYYIIKDTTNPLPTGEQADLVVVQVVKSVTITAKGGTPTFDKQVKDRNDTTQKPGVYDDWGTTSDYDVGDDVPYKITVTLPANFSNFTTYKMTVKDKLDAGLSFNNDVAVYVGDSTTALANNNYEVKTTGLSTGESFEIAFPAVQNIGGAAAGVTFTITYSAKLTGDSVVYGNPGNKNEAWLTYTNSPDSTQEGGTTPHKTTVTFTYKFKVNKIDQNGDPLTGATFALSKKEQKADGTYLYVTKTLVTGGSGTFFTFDGLDDGIYKLEETVTPAGYNSIDPIFFKVEATHGDTITALSAVQVNEDGTALNGTAVATFSAQLTKQEASGENPEIPAGLISTNITNNKGPVLPSTGGIGTTIFYVLGSVLVVGAVVLLITKRRMSR